jgi:hypothetical protein
MSLAHQARYVGNLSGCTIGPNAQATLVQAVDRFSFAPSDGALVVSGSVTPDGSFTGSLVTSPPGHDRQGRPGTETFSLTATGRIEGDVASGTYATPRCRTAFHLHRVYPTIWP